MDEQLIRNILLSYRELRKETQTILEEQSKKYGISTTQLFILDMLNKYPHSSLLDLAKRVNLSNSTTSEVVDKMVRAGYIDRVQSQVSRRNIELSLTHFGKDTLDKTYSNYIAAFEVFEELTEVKLLAFYDTQQAMIEQLKQRRLNSEQE